MFARQKTAPEHRKEVENLEKIKADCLTAVIQSIAEGGQILIKSIVTHPFLLILFALLIARKIIHIFSK